MRLRRGLRVSVVAVIERAPSARTGSGTIYLVRWPASLSYCGKPIGTEKRACAERPIDDENPE